MTNPTEFHLLQLIKNCEIEITLEVLEVYGWLHATVCLCSTKGNAVVNSFLAFGINIAKIGQFNDIYVYPICA